MISVALKIIISYLLGSISGSMVIGKIKGVDIRTMGSGNAGGTNAFRTQGIKFAIAVFIIDIGKGFVSTFYVPHLVLPFMSAEMILSVDLLIVLCGLAAVIGHVYPLYYNFKGGKGAGAAIGMIFAIAPLIMFIAIVIWLIILLLTGYVGLGTMIAAISIPFFSFIFEVNNQYFLYSTSLLATFIIFAHRSNIQRIIKGTENRFEKARIFHRSNDSD